MNQKMRCGISWLLPCMLISLSCGIACNSNSTEFQTTASSVTPPFVLNDFAAVSPVDDEDFRISSPFGPRLKASDGFRYDFHRGVDIPGNEGDEIHAIASGTIASVYAEGSDEYPEGGNVVVIRHEQGLSGRFHDQDFSRVYSVYMHLESFAGPALQALTSQSEEPVTTGDTIGTMGQSGSTDFTHLHFELRLATSCSLSYQIENPDSACADFGFDPHVNPLFLYDAISDGSIYGVEILSVTEASAVIRITAPADHLLIDQIYVNLYDSENIDRQLLESSALGMSSRAGFDATSTASLDDNETGGFVIEPDEFSEDSDEYGLTLTYSWNEELWDEQESLYLQVLAGDVGGMSVSATTRLK